MNTEPRPLTQAFACMKNLVMTEFFEPISLGAKCETKYQIARVLNERLWPERSEMTFRYAITRRPRDADFSRWRLFDWLGTPLRAVCDLIEQDFRGVYELEDFVPSPLGAHNRRFGTNHLHDFVAADGGASPTPKEIIEQYPNARREFEERAADFRALLTEPGPYLYVVVDPEEPETQVPRLLALLGRHPQHRFHVLLVDHQGANEGLPDFGPQVSRAFREGSSKPTNFAWEGDDISWNAVLEPYVLGRHPLPVDGSPESVDRSVASRAADVWMGGGGKPVIWRGGADAVFCYLFWREQGANLEQAEDGAHLTTIARPWTYSACVKLDLSDLDFARQRVWARVTFKDVDGHLMLAAYDPTEDRLCNEVLVGAGAGPQVLEIELSSEAQRQLMLRTGEPAEAAHAIVVDVDIVAVGKPAAA